MQIKGRWFIKVFGEQDVEISGDNVVTAVGKEFLASYLSSGAAGAAVFDMDQIAIGTDSTAAADTDTALGTESARTTGTASYVSNAIYRVTATFPSGTGTGAIVEYGLLSSTSAGTLFNRDVESVINKGANDTLTVVTEVTFT